MRSFATFSLCFFLSLGCSNTEDEPENLTTSFQGIAINSISNNEPFTGQIEVIGSFLGVAPEDVFRRTFQIESNGSFDITVTTKDVGPFQLSLIGYSQECNDPTGEVPRLPCTFFSAGIDHTNIEIYVLGPR
jgi:hypothetical protein